jgi:hypothetical protein
LFFTVSKKIARQGIRNYLLFVVFFLGQELKRYSPSITMQRAVLCFLHIFLIVLGIIWVFYYSTSPEANVLHQEIPTSTIDASTSRRLLVLPEKTQRHGTQGASSSESKAARVRKRFPGVHVNSSWIGNRWFPSYDVIVTSPSKNDTNYRRQLYNALELRDIFSRYNILWIGDSSGGQEYATLFRIMNSSSTFHIDVEGKDLKDPLIMDTTMTTVEQHYQHTCQILQRKMTICRNSQGKLFDWLYKKCVDDLNITNWQDLFRNYSLIIISLGANELASQCSHTKDENDVKLKRFTTFIDHLTKIDRDDLMIIYRTMGSIGNVENKPNLDRTSWHDASNYNQILVSQMNDFQELYFSQRTHMPILSYVDFGSIILPHRSYPDSLRIKGSLPIHYGVEARVALIQMLANHLNEREEERNPKPPNPVSF